MPPKLRDASAVVSWRRKELMQCGFPRSLASRVARDERYDLHQLIELVGQGCSPALAVRILSPIDDAPHRPSGAERRAEAQPEARR